ncbi:cytochrome P450 [Lysobacter silvisoli]|uniref:Cytochrome P450 n=1 Tax=Lysobacter silvisoli TaxID=2293254 RepID=A0A371K0C4_9GAMM|nr:cytochrome P450 [Lysobacter silvisoli]RDZ27371.1 cytochrome P450 [Lysobacter silvisoli]
MQDTKIFEIPSVQAFRRRLREEGPVFQLQEQALVIFDPKIAERVEAENYADLTMLDGFSDVVRGRESEAVSWHQVRGAWLTQMRTLTSAEGFRRLAQRMQGVLDAEAGREQDFVWLAERAMLEPLIPAIIGGLSPRAHKRVVDEVLSKVALVLSDIDAHRCPPLHRSKMWLYQFVSSVEVRRELKGRASGKRPRQQDLTDPMVDMLPDLGVDRATDAVTALLTAITSSPGAAAACLFYEWQRQHEWRERMTAELSAHTLDALCESPVRLAPVTARFVKEILRIWSSPPIVTRRVRGDICQEQVDLKTDQVYVLSSFFVHHDQTTWSDPETFNPDRWLAESREQCPHGSYVPFGWAPKSCVGANLGLGQLILMAHLLATRYRLDVRNPDEAKMAIASVIRPMDFHGQVRRV